MADEIQTNEVPIEPKGPEAPNPAEKTTPGSEHSSIDDALAKAFEEQGVKAEDETPKPKAKEEPKPKEPKEAEKPDPKAKVDPKAEEAKAEHARREDGKFAAKEPTESPGDESGDKGTGQEGGDNARPSEGRNIDTPPARFLPRAKEKWASADPDVRSEVYRAFEEMQKGLDESKQDREFRKEIREFEEMAKQHGTTVPNALRQYTAIDRQLKEDPAGAVERILGTIGLSPQQYAQYIMGQAQQQAANPQTAQTNQITQTVQQLQQELAAIRQRDQQREAEERENAVINKIIDPFKAEHPRYEELEGDIAFFLNSGKIPSTLSERERLETAYDMAERINPAPSFAKGPLNPALAAPLTQAGDKSVSGSPSSGIPTNKPKKKGEHVSIDDALERAFQRAG